MKKPFEIALAEFGVSQFVGDAANTRVLRYFKEIGHSWVQDDEVAWCAAFINWCLLKAGYQHNGSLLARSFLSYGSETNTPELGDLVVLWRISRNSPYGHTGFYISETLNEIYVLGGNQDGRVSIKAYPKGLLLGYRKIHA